MSPWCQWKSDESKLACSCHLGQEESDECKLVCSCHLSVKGKVMIVIWYFSCHLDQKKREECKWVCSECTLICSECTLVCSECTLVCSCRLGQEKSEECCDINFCPSMYLDFLRAKIYN